MFISRTVQGWAKRSPEFTGERSSPQETLAAPVRPASGLRLELAMAQSTVKTVIETDNLATRGV